MQLPENFNFKPANVLKIAGLAIVAIIVITLAFRLIYSSTQSLAPRTMNDQIGLGGDFFSQSSPSYNSGPSYDKAEEMAYDGSAPILSARNAASSISPEPGMTAGDDAEAYEVKEYSAHVETRDLADTCSRITILKAREDVIFERADEYEKSCSYYFKVKNSSTAEILAVIESLDPKELNESAYTIKNIIRDYTSEEEILRKKLASVEETFTSAVNAYDEISQLATRVQDVESLANIINSKVSIIERLAQQRISINAQLEQLGRAKAEQLDRLDYTFFNVYIVENKYIDGQDLKDSWKYAIKYFVRDVNEVAQDVTVNFVLLLIKILQFILYFFVVLFVAKYGWRAARYIWKR